MNLGKIGKIMAALFCFWSFWVVLEWQRTLRDLTSSGSIETPGRESSLASFGIVPATPRAQAVQFAPTESTLPIPPSLASTSLEAAQGFFDEKKKEWGVKEYHQLRPTTYESPLGTKVKYAAYQDGLPIIGSEIMLDVTPDRQVSLTENNYLPLKKADLSQPVMEYATLLRKSPGGYQLDKTMTTGVSKILYVVPGSDEPELSYVMAVKESGTGPTEQLVFRATDGMILGRQTPRSEF